MNTSWPERFEVQIKKDDAGAITYSVCTWGSAKTAANIAMLHHTLYGSFDGGSVTGVTALGRPLQDEKGVIIVNPGDLVDRMEW